MGMLHNSMQLEISHRMQNDKAGQIPLKTIKHNCTFTLEVTFSSHIVG
jgi:hypothetical protein